MNVLVVDVGGSNLKCIATGQTEPRTLNTGRDFTPARLVEGVAPLIAGWSWDVASIGFPGPIKDNRVLRDPHNLGPGWVGFDFRAAFGKPVRVLNDAAMQALGSYRGGHMLFLGLGTGLGSAMVIDGAVHPLELAHLPFRKRRSYEDMLGDRGLARLGKKRWRKAVNSVLELMYESLLPDYVVIGGGNAKKLEALPPWAVLGSNKNAFRGGFMLWSEETRASAVTDPSVPAHSA
jgi:predicted NBD/HSP70 family sugar kinase